MLPACSTTANPRTTFSHLNYRRDPSSSLFRSSPSSLSFNPLTLRSSFTHHYGIRTSVKSETSNRRRTSTGFRVLSYIAPSPFTTPNLQWISAVSSLVLILAKGTAVPKSFIVPLFALQAPAGVVAWINALLPLIGLKFYTNWTNRGRYGLWSAFLALLVRLFFYIPGELELPFIALLLVIVAPYEALRLRDTKEGAAISLLIAVYLAFQHFSRTSLQKSFDQGSIVATLGVICITVSSLLLLI